LALEGVQIALIEGVVVRKAVLQVGYDLVNSLQWLNFVVELASLLSKFVEVACQLFYHFEVPLQFILQDSRGLQVKSSALVLFTYSLNPIAVVACLVRLQVVKPSIHLLHLAEQQVDVFKILNIVLFCSFFDLNQSLL